MKLPEVTSPMRRVRRIHLLGIGGSGMAGIAEVLLNLGYQVTGSDLKESGVTRRLVGLGARVGYGHDPRRLDGADVVVVSTAIAADNPEYAAARARQLPIVRRAEMLAELMRFRYGVAVAGTHGKTTTTSLIAAVLAEGGLDPTYVIGGRLKSAGANARLGQGPWLVAEADESDASFLHLSPLVAVVTNIDVDHLETYGGDFDRLKTAFVEFLHRLPFYGLAVLCADDPTVQGLIGDLGRPTFTYGTDASADLRATQLRPRGDGSEFVAVCGDWQETLYLNLPGRHNVANALAAVAVARELEVPIAAVRKALAEFAGVGRRLEAHGWLTLAGARVELFDDYGHHPREIEVTLRALSEARPGRRQLVVFQPHRYSRTRQLFDDFCAVLARTDALILTEIYAAGEPPPTADFDGRTLARGVRARGGVEPVFVGRLDEVPVVLARVVRDDDVVLTLGAGDIGGLSTLLRARFGANGAGPVDGAGDGGAP